MNFPLIVHCSTDEIFCRYGSSETKIPYKDLERTLPNVLTELIEENKPSSIVIINGPGGFTALRIGTLCVTMASKYYDLPMYNWTKIQLYESYIAQGLLPSTGYISIGQRKNIWLYDFERNDKTMVTVGGNYAHGSEYFIDMLSIHLVVDELDGNKKTILSGSHEGLICSYLSKKSLISWEELCNENHKKENLVPEYMIEPTLG